MSRVTGGASAAKGRSTKRRAIARAVLLLSSLVFTLLAVEIGFRLLVFGVDGLSITKMNSVHPFGLSGFVQASEIPEIAWEIRPNQVGLFKLAPFTSNSLGLCDREYSLLKPDGAFRIAVLGDSFTMPGGVALEDAYHSRIEEELSERFPGRTYELINFGVSGYYLRQYRAVLEHNVPSYAPDLVLVGFCALNDHYVPPGDYFDEPLVPAPASKAFFSSFVLEQVAQRLHSGEDNPDQGAGDEDAYMKEELLLLKQAADRLGAPVVVAYLSILPTDPARVRRHVEDAGLRFVDASSPFTAESYAENKIYLIDGHPNPRSHQEFARIIGEYLVDEGLVPTN